MIPVLYPLLLLNLISFLLMGIDKYRAKKKNRRIPERTLLWSAFLFGGAGGFVGMRLFRHKTKHKKFTILLPLFLLLQAAALYFAFDAKWIVWM